jgi:16S rRNA (guanine1207-N2)-methyltransferase
VKFPLTRDEKKPRIPEVNLKELKKDIVFTEHLKGYTFTFHSTWGLFSPKRIDQGTKLLIRHLDVKTDDDCLDLGCGYGAIGCVMARCASRGTTLFIDKDFTAIEYAQKNVEINGLDNCVVKLSNGLSNVEKKDFDIIAANLPSNVGKELLTILLLESKKRLARGGRLYVVTVTGLRKFIKRNLLTIFGTYEKLKQGQNHTVASAVKKKVKSI